MRQRVGAFTTALVVAASALTVLGATAPARAVATCTGAHPDFNGDGCADLAVGAPGEHGGRGLVYVFYGSATGLTATTGSAPQWFGQDLPGVWGTGAPGDGFGAATTTGDFDGDGYDDLAVGAPGDTVSGRRNAGLVHVFFGGPNGLTVAGNQRFSEDTPFFPDTAQTDDLFGSALSAGDFNGDGLADLAIGIPGEHVGFVPSAGAVLVLLGSSHGPGHAKWFTQVSPGVIGSPAVNGSFGFALASGRFGTDALDDLAVGIPGAVVSGRVQAGAVFVMAGHTTLGLNPFGQLWTEANGSFPGSSGAESGDLFGWSLAAGDLNRDGRDDIAVGAPGEHSGSAAFAGAVLVLDSATRLFTSGGQFINQETPGVYGGSNANQEFGHAIVVAPLDSSNGTVYDALVVGVPYEWSGGVQGSGRAQILPSSVSGVTGTGSTTLDLTTPGLCSCGPTTEGWFGISMGAGDFDGDGLAELVVAAPAEDVGSAIAAGAIYLLRPDANTDDHGGAPIVDPIPGGPLHWTEDSAGIVGAASTGDLFGAALSA